jgi:hypothetical protein
VSFLSLVFREKPTQRVTEIIPGNPWLRMTCFRILTMEEGVDELVIIFGISIYNQDSYPRALKSSVKVWFEYDFYLGKS